MTPETVLTVGQQTLEVVVMLAGPLLVSALVVGILVSMIQAATQINEMTMTFIPKLIAVGAVMTFGGPYMIRTITDFTTRLFENIPGMIG